MPQFPLCPGSRFAMSAGTHLPARGSGNQHPWVHFPSYSLDGWRGPTPPAGLVPPGRTGRLKTGVEELALPASAGNVARSHHTLRSPADRGYHPTPSSPGSHTDLSKPLGSRKSPQGQPARDASTGPGLLSHWGQGQPWSPSSLSFPRAEPTAATITLLPQRTLPRALLPNCSRPTAHKPSLTPG